MEGKIRSLRLFRALLRLLPRDFRKRFGEEMEAIFVEQRTDALGQGRRGAVRLWWSTAMGILLTAPGEHLDALRQDLRYAARLMRRD
jgi:hypothetical protein